MAELVFLNDVSRKPNTVLTVGSFDGVHKGHQALIDTVVRKAQERDARSVIVTFDPHPRTIINPGASGINLLTTLEERCRRLEEHGIDMMVVIPFDRDFSLKSSDEFVRDTIYEKIGVSEFVIGYDHHFGKDREGSIETVERLGEELGFASYVVSKKEVGETTVSSTKIRQTLSEEGNVRLAEQLLGWKYTLSGTVVQGQQRGQTLGFPTANIVPDHANKVIPAIGVYAVDAEVDGEKYRGMMNIGRRPTFEQEGQPSLEVHLFDFDRDIYGMKLRVTFLERIRDEVSFEGKEQLITQLKRDKKIAQEIKE